MRLKYNHLQQNERITQTRCRVKEARQKSHVIWFICMAFQKQVRLIHGVRTQDSRNLITRESKYIGGFGDAANILFLDAGLATLYLENSL